MNVEYLLQHCYFIRTGLYCTVLVECESYETTFVLPSSGFKLNITKIYLLCFWVQICLIFETDKFPSFLIDKFNIAALSHFISTFFTGM